jgi:diaminohydroxyphosphoribosylaminopyrimidine deaminase/5-amino-6-(5-phosphoribosylamino)uracil reductase
MSALLPNPDNFLEDAAPLRYMREAVALALRGRWSTAPNPSVGAVLVKDKEVVGRGWHKYCGGPHAEIEALEDCRKHGVSPSDCTLYVTLEPCNHTGKTPPCTRAILKAGIKRVVVGALDPNPDVSGGGVEYLRSQGVEVEIGLAEQESLDLIADFTAWRVHKRPYSILKLASTLDGKIATRAGHSQWITGPAARAEVHRLRGKVCAVVVGGNTLRLDNPQLTCRISINEGDRPQPLAVVVTSQLPDPKSHLYLLRERSKETVFWTTESAASSPRAEALAALGCSVWGLPALGAGLDLAYGYRRLFEERNCLYALCEGGGALGCSLLEAGLADELLLFYGAMVIGDAEAKSLFTGRSIETLDQALGLRVQSVSMLGDNLALRLLPRAR